MKCARCEGKGYVVEDTGEKMPGGCLCTVATRCVQCGGTGEVHDNFVGVWRVMQRGVHQNAITKGWWESKKDPKVELLLLHAEISEAAEALRCGNPPDKHIPEFTGLEAELADVVIRIMDLSEGLGLRVAEAVKAKAEYNRGRPHRHGGKEF